MTINVFDAGGNFVTTSTTASDGSYKIVGLTPSATGYKVCFDATNATGGRSITGYASQCYNNVAWSVFSAPPASTTPVPVAAGATASGISAALTADWGHLRHCCGCGWWRRGDRRGRRGVRQRWELCHQ